MADFKIGARVIKNPSTFKISRYKVTNMERLANAEMVGDLIAKKKKFFFTYDAISAEELDNILDAIWDGPLFFTLTYPENGSIHTAKVYVGEIPSELHSASANWVWKGVNFNLIEK